MPRIRNYARERKQRLFRYHREREQLIIRLGGKCALCPCKEFARLEFDHPNGRPYALETLSRLSRLRLYRKEADQGTVRLLCRTCNAQDGGGKRNGNGLYCPERA